MIETRRLKSVVIFVQTIQEIILKTKYFERGLSQSLQKVHFIYSFEPSPFKEKYYEK